MKFMASFKDLKAIASPKNKLKLADVPDIRLIKSRISY